MWLRGVRIDRCVRAVTRNGDPFLKVWVRPGGRMSCFYEDVFPDLQAACDKKMTIDVEIAESDSVDGRGKPYQNLLATRSANGLGASAP